LINAAMIEKQVIATRRIATPRSRSWRRGGNAVDETFGASIRTALGAGAVGQTSFRRRNNAQIRRLFRVSRLLCGHSLGYSLTPSCTPILPILPALSALPKA
jgi:hypothetical protein